MISINFIDRGSPDRLMGPLKKIFLVHVLPNDIVESYEQIIIGIQVFSWEGLLLFACWM